MENTKFPSNVSSFSSKELIESKINFSHEFLDFLQEMFNLVDKFKTLKSLLLTNKLKISNHQINSQNKGDNYYIIQKRSNNQIFNFKNLFKNLNLSEKIPFIKSFFNTSENKYFGYFITFFDSITIYGRSPIKSHNFYHYITQAWLLTVFGQIKNIIKSERNSSNNITIKNFKELFFFVKNIKLHEQLFLKNLEIILGTYDLTDHIIKVSEFKLSQQFLKKLKIVFDTDSELKSSFKNLKYYMQYKEEKKCCLEDFFNFNLSFKGNESLKENYFNFEMNNQNYNNHDNDFNNLNLNVNNNEKTDINNNIEVNLINNILVKNEEEFLNDKNFDLTKSGFLYLLKDIFDKVLNYTLNELDTREKNKDSSKLYDTYHFMVFSKYFPQNLDNLFVNSENDNSFLLITNDEKESTKNKMNSRTIFPDSSNYLNFARTTAKTVENKRFELKYEYDSENKIPYDIFYKELKKNEKINHLTDLSNFENQTINNINNMSSIANEFSENAMEENSINSFVSDAELLNPNQTFYDYGITTMNELFEDIELITLKSGSFWEKIYSMIKNNCYKFKKNLKFLIKNNFFMKKMIYLIHFGCNNLKVFKKVIRDKITSTEENCRKTYYHQIRNWISSSVEYETNSIKKFNLDYWKIINENFVYFKNNFFLMFKQPRVELNRYIILTKNFLKENMNVFVQNVYKKGKKKFFLCIDYENFKNIVNNENFIFLMKPLYSLINYLSNIYNNFFNDKNYTWIKYELVIKIINIPTEILKTEMKLIYNFINYFYELVKKYLIYYFEEPKDKNNLNQFYFSIDKNDKAKFDDYELFWISESCKKLALVFSKKFGLL